MTEKWNKQGVHVNKKVMRHLLQQAGGFLPFQFELQLQTSKHTKFITQEHEFS